MKSWQDCIKKVKKSMPDRPMSEILKAASVKWRKIRGVGKTTVKKFKKSGFRKRTKKGRKNLRFKRTKKRRGHKRRRSIKRGGLGEAFAAPDEFALYRDEEAFISALEDKVALKDKVLSPEDEEKISAYDLAKKTLSTKYKETFNAYPTFLKGDKTKADKVIERIQDLTRRYLVKSKDYKNTLDDRLEVKLNTVDFLQELDPISDGDTYFGKLSTFYFFFKELQDEKPSEIAISTIKSKQFGKSWSKAIFACGSGTKHPQQLKFLDDMYQNNTKSVPGIINQFLAYQSPVVCKYGGLVGINLTEKKALVTRFTNLSNDFISFEEKAGCIGEKPNKIFNSTTFQTWGDEILEKMPKFKTDYTSGPYQGEEEVNQGKVTFVPLSR